MQRKNTSRGLLKIEKGMPLIPAVIGIVLKVIQDTRLLSNIPKEAIKFYAKYLPADLLPSASFKIKNLFWHTSKSEKNEEPQSQTINLENDTISITRKKIKKDQLVIISKIPNNTANITPDSSEDYNQNYYFVATYKSVGEKKDDMPESGYAIEIENQGFLPKELLSIDNDSFIKFKGDIFPHQPLIADIKQGTFGDCFFLSTLIAILNIQKKVNNQLVYEGADYIQNMMLQVNDDFTVVRLFDPGKKEFVYFKVENTMYSQGGKDTQQSAVFHASPWVHLLEKAYVALGAKPNQGKKDKEIKYVNQSFREIYGKGGRPEFAMKIITGFDATYFPMHDSSIIETNRFPWSSDFTNIYINLAHTQDELDQALHALKNNPNDSELKTKIKLLSDSIDTRYNNSATSVSHIDITKVLTKPEAIKWGHFINMLNKDHPDLYKAFKRLIRDAEHQTVQDVMHDFNEFRKLLTQQNNIILYPENIFAKFNTFLNERLNSSDGRQYGRLPFALKTGSYSLEQMEIFNKISNEVAKGNLVVASTPEKFSENELGLRPNHAYAVIGVEEKKYKDTTLKFIKLVNPWGQVGRDYNWDTEDAKEMPLNVESKISGGEFTIELHEFCRIFAGYSVGKFLDMTLQPQAQPVSEIKMQSP